MKIYNTLTRKKEEFTPQTGNEFRIYVCGPTVYNVIHIGNARPLCVFDVLRRYLEYRGYGVKLVQNFTDIDDKIIDRAHKEGVDFTEISKKYIAEYWTDAKGLGVREASIHPRATENIDGILEIIGALVAKGHAYVVPGVNGQEGDVYFSAGSFKEYGKLSHQPLEDLEAGARIGVDEAKKDPVDFALWKAAKPGEPSWDSPYGKGRPGWHIECSAMARRYLGETIDLHCGGQDLIFPHHENEIAQSECCNGVPFARFWMHNGYINADNRKMSKSLGNFFTVREISAVYGYEPIRYFLLSAHYRSPINFSAEVIEQGIAALNRLYTSRENLAFALGTAGDGGQDTLAAQAEARKAQFIEAMEDDLNTADAIAALFELARDANSAKHQSRAALARAAEIFDELAGVLGLLSGRETAAIPSGILELAQQRQQARQNKDFAAADALRAEITARGYSLEDTPDGPKVTKTKER